MHPSLRIQASFSLLTILMLSFPLTALATETASTVAPALEIPAGTTIANPTPVSPSPAPTTSVMINPATMAQSAPLITLTLKQMIEEHREGEGIRSPFILKDKLDAYTITIQNNQPNPVVIVSSEIRNRVTPELAYLKLKQSAGAAYATQAGMGLALVPLTMGGSLVVGALVGGPLAASMIGSRNKKLLTYVNQCPGTIPLVTLLPGESKSFTVLTEKMVKPEIHLTVQDLKTQALFTYPNGGI
jgi:hypothetical protein